MSTLGVSLTPPSASTIDEAVVGGSGHGAHSDSQGDGGEASATTASLPAHAIGHEGVINEVEDRIQAMATDQVQEDADSHDTPKVCLFVVARVDLVMMMETRGTRTGLSESFDGLASSNG